MKNFGVAYGSITGVRHKRSNQNNQDALYYKQDENIFVGCVADGCSDFPHSEVGAKLAVRLIVEAIIQNYEFYFNLFDLSNKAEQTISFWEMVRKDILKQMVRLSRAMNGDFLDVVYNYFLFTIVGFMITPIKTQTFSIGDGVIFLNGEKTLLGPYPEGKSPYIAYGLFDHSVSGFTKNFLRFTISHFLRTEDVNSILIGTDGVCDLENFAVNKIPGKSELIGNISQFWEDKKYFENPNMVNLKLASINNEVRTIDWEKQVANTEYPLLQNDTSLIVVKRLND